MNQSKRQNIKQKQPKRNGKKVNPFPRFDAIKTGNPLIHTFTRSVNMQLQIGTSGIIPQVGVVPYPNFSIWYTPQSVFLWGNSTNYITASVPGFSDLAALFDEVQIERVDMEIYPTSLEATTAVIGSAHMLLVTDYNDKNAPAVLADALQYEDAKVVPLLTRSPYKETHVPKLLTYTLDSAGSAVASVPTRAFVRSNLDIEHYCRKGSFVSLPSNTQYYTILFKYKFNCKIVK